MSKNRRQRGRRGANDIMSALRRNWAIFVAVGFFSGIVNVLALTGSMYMLQIYDRVLTSHSLPTLVGLSVLMAGLYVAYGLLDFFRVRLMSRVGMRIDEDVSGKVFAVVQLLPLRAQRELEGERPIRDLDAIRQFLSGLGPTALFDMPWLPVYLGVVYLLHPMLGLFATAGAVLLVGLTIWSEVASAAPVRRAAQSYKDRSTLAEAAHRNAQTSRALGMSERIGARWQTLNTRYVDDTTAASDATSAIGTASKILRLLLQSGMLGLGAYFAVKGEVTAGVIIAASITLSRALAPIELAISHWRGFVAARQGYHRLVTLFDAVDLDQQERLKLPAPHKSLSVHNLFVAPPGASKPVISNVNFELQAGDAMGVIGATAAGKSTLGRALVGIWKPSHIASAIRVDGASLDQWPPTELGRHIGYLPQDIGLFEGTVAENIARFDPEAKSDDIIAAARAANCHELVVRLPDGYQTRIGDDGQKLSGGQRQRIALARALYGDPFLIVLDEPNANLDADGEAALTQAIAAARARGGIVIVIAHRPAAIAAVNMLLMVADGQVKAFGPRDEVLRKVMQGAAPGQSAVPGMGSGQDQGTGQAHDEGAGSGPPPAPGASGVARHGRESAIDRNAVALASPPPSHGAALQPASATSGVSRHAAAPVEAIDFARHAAVARPLRPDASSEPSSGHGAGPGATPSSGVEPHNIDDFGGIVVVIDHSERGS
ncbi:MAG: type I secretion system permease/ATPase [Hyphomicrobiaceae bacterium]|nr:type I secretion system permease/ATPase [Hyphomicrobiaceae bacterium]